MGEAGMRERALQVAKDIYAGNYVADGAAADAILRLWPDVAALPAGPYSYEHIPAEREPANYRVRDVDDNRIATCYVESNARAIVAALNRVAALEVYAARYGRSQSLERLAERGGFGAGEMDELYPGWQEECFEISALRADLAALREEGARFRTLIEQAVIAPEDHDGGTAYPVEYGEYDAADVFQPPATLPNIPALEKERDALRLNLEHAQADNAANAEEAARLREENGRLEARLDEFKPLRNYDALRAQLADAERVIAEIRVVANSGPAHWRINELCEAFLAGKASADNASRAAAIVASCGHWTGDAACRACISLALTPHPPERGATIEEEPHG